MVGCTFILSLGTRSRRPDVTGGPRGEVGGQLSAAQVVCPGLVHLAVTLEAGHRRSRVGVDGVQPQFIEPRRSHK